MGRQLAEGFRKTARGRAFKRRKERRPFAFSLKNAEATLTTYAPNLWEELHGLADGLEISLDRAVAEFSNGRLRYPARGCSAVMAGGLYGRNYDYSIKRYDRILAAVRPDGVYASVGFSDRFTGRDDGMNEHGLCVGLHYVNDRIWQPGLTCLLIVRIVLDQCASTSEAIDLLRRLPHGLCYNYSLVDASGDAAVVEASPKGVHVRQGNGLACANHFQSAELAKLNRRNPGSHRRLPHLAEWAGAAPEAERLFELLNSSRSPVFAHGYAKGHGTLHSWVGLPSSRELIVGVGGDAQPVRISVAEWAKGSPPAINRLEGVLGGTLKPFDPKKRVRDEARDHSTSQQKVFAETDLSSAVFRDLSLENSSFENINLGGASFDNINFAGAAITRNCNFSGMEIAGVSVEDLFAAYRREKARDEEDT